MSTVLATEITPQENLLLQGIPPIPIALAEASNRYTEFRSASLASWHPVRREILISTRFGDVAQVHLVKFPLGSRQQLTFFPEPVFGGMFQPTQGEYFVFSKDIGGNEFRQNYRYDLASGAVTLLTDGTSKNSRGLWSNAGTQMAYHSTRRNGKDNDLYLIDPLHPERDRLLTAVEGGGWFLSGWSPDDRQLVLVEYISITETYLWLVEVASGEKTLLTSKGGEPVAYQSAVFDRSGQGLYVVCDRDSEFLQLVYLDLGTRQFTNLIEEIEWDIEQICLSHDGRRLAFTVNANGASILHLLDTTTKQELPLPALPLGQVYGLNWHRNNRDLGFTLVSARSSADVYSLDLETAQVERWTESETGGLNTDSFAEPTLIEWQSFDDRTISGFLYRPVALPNRQGKYPVIINIHGGPEGQFRPSFLGRSNFYLNELGIALIFPNVRGSSGYGKTFLKLDNGYLREDSVKDIGALLDWIATQPDLDSERILVTGGSYGGYMSLAVATHYGDRIRASIDIVGISNFVTFLEKTESYRRDLRRVEYGDERDPQMRAFLLNISPVNNANKIQKPLLIIHGANDPRVPLQEAEQIREIVGENGIPVWYLVAKDEGHGFSKKKNVDFQFYATVLFIRTFLLND